MSVVDSVLGAVAAKVAFSSHEFLGPARAHRPGGAEKEGDWWPTPKGSSGAGARVWLLRVRDRARELISSNAGSAIAATNAGTVSSSRSDAVSAAAVAGSIRSRSASFEVKITNLAVKQVNEGDELTSSSTNAIQPGKNTFKITVGTGSVTTVEFASDSTDTYEEALEKLATEINSADAGVSAGVTEDEDAGTVQLVLTADSSGVTNRFMVEDVTGDVVSTTGIGSVTDAAENAEVFVNGVPRSSASNTVLIDHGRVELTLKMQTGPTGNDDEIGAVISVEPDTLSKAVLELAGSLNGFRNRLKTEGSTQDLRTRDSFDKLVSNSKAGLKAMGITIDDDGKLNVDPERLEAAIVNNRATVNALLGDGAGLGVKLSGAAGEALEESRVRAQHDKLVGTDGTLLGDQLIAPGRGISRGALVDVVG